jgi:hypothetical protein
MKMKEHKKYMKWYILCGAFGFILGATGNSPLQHPIKFFLLAIPFWIAPFIYPNKES